MLKNILTMIKDPKIWGVIVIILLVSKIELNLSLDRNLEPILLKEITK